MKQAGHPPLYCALALAATLILATGCAAPRDTAKGCPKPGDWISPATAGVLTPRAVLNAASRNRIVLLGESHANKEHHLWQAYMLAALHARNPKLVVGFEMFPRAAQPVLDDWSRGALGEKAFLEKSDWNRVWSFDVALYRPLLHFPRQHRLKMIALNVERALVSRVGREGWQAVPKSERHGLGDPAPASRAYRRALLEVFAARAHSGKTQGKPDPEETLKSTAFNRFVDAQLTWDRAMAEALAQASRAQPDALIVGIVGSGHIRNHHGIPHQLADLGINDDSVLFAVESDEACGAPDATLADALFVVAPDDETATAPARPRLGVMIADAGDGVRVRRVLPGTVAAEAGLKDGDIILSAAGFAVRKTTELIEIILRQAPGTWLPLRVRRGDAEIDAVARFP
ncbi:MAG: ChaN family lipoprotein [Alphaproteobacteria bacterium]